MDTRHTRLALLSGLLLIFATPALGAEGVVLVNQARVEGSGGFPFDITQAGTYRLTSNLDVTGAADPPNTTAITVNSSDAVFIDLNGFSIVGPGSAGNGNGIEILAGLGHSIRNGIIRGMGGDGIDSPTADLVHVEAVTAVDNGGVGIRLDNRATVIRCRAARNGGAGVIVNQFGTMFDNLVHHNGGNGLSSGQKGDVHTGNISWRNTGHGIFGKDATSSQHNIAKSNGGWGITLSGNSTIVSNLSGDNGGTGLGGGESMIFRYNVSLDNTLNGISVGSHHALIYGNLLLSNDNDGILTLRTNQGVGLNSFSYNDQDGDGDILRGSLSGYFFTNLLDNFCEPGTCEVVE